ncbi:MAG: hypothetical protein H5T86_12565, partial [Armatimonadetes bacterium]|nr:hypothetical protein [Armatimonadota bacterium]
MRRLIVRRDGDEVGLDRRPAIQAGPSELVACVVAAAQVQGAPLEYGGLLCDCGAAFALRVSPVGFRHVEALTSQLPGLLPALQMWGFRHARIGAAPEAPTAEARPELEAGRAVAVAGCFPEAPWRAGLVVHVGRDGLWTLMDVTGRLHRAAPRATVLVTLGKCDGAMRPALAARLALWLSASDDAKETVAAGWRAWLDLLSRPDTPSPSEIAAHEYLYEVLLDGRTHAAGEVAAASEQDEGVVADWLRVAAARLEQLVAHLEARRPPLHSP